MSKSYKPHLPINAWAEDDRPREKMTKTGKNSLSNAELIAILLGSGSKNESAVELAKRILFSIEDNLIELSKLGVKELCAFKGIGPAKAISIIAALELGRRRRGAEVLKRKKILCSQDAFELLQMDLSDCKHEEFWIILLNRGNQVLKTARISEGGLSGTIADPKRIFKTAIDHQASAIILSHNHPSGNTRPSSNDINITQKLIKAGQTIDIQVLDHIIIGTESYYSFSDEGKI